MLRVLAMLALAAFVLAAGPADAHVGSAERAVFETPELLAASEATSPPQFFVAGDSTDFRWPISLIALLTALALIRRRSRRLVAAVLVLLIAVLGVEAAVHSVHHASGGQPVACPTASVAAHLNGTTVAMLALDEPVHPVGTATDPSGSHLASLRSLDPSQPRAPPFALA
jgi:hypothetical protein